MGDVGERPNHEIYKLRLVLDVHCRSISTGFRSAPAGANGLCSNMRSGTTNGGGSVRCRMALLECPDCTRDAPGAEMGPTWDSEIVARVKGRDCGSNSR